MKKYFYLIPLALLGFAPLSVGAATVNLSGVDIALPNGITISVAGSQSQAESVTINSDNVSFSMSEGEAMYITSSNRYTLTNSLGVVTTCGSTMSSVALAVHNGEGTKTITVTPSTTLCSSGSSGGGGGDQGGILITGGGGGGGGSSYVPPTPAAPSTTQAPQVASPVVQQTPAATVSPVFNKDLAIGARSNDVTRLQTLLSQDALIYPEKLLTGYFGAKTMAAVKRFQKKYGISQIGRVGPATRAKLNQLFGGKGSASPAPSSPPSSAGNDAAAAALQVQLKALQDQLQSMSAAKPAGKQITVQLKEQNASGESGTAVITQVDGTAGVTIQVTRTGPAPLVDTPQLAHIHRGSCSELGNITYPLSSLVNGKSVTTLPISLDTLLTQLPLAINVHKSISEANIYVACGNITQ